MLLRHSRCILPVSPVSTPNSSSNFNTSSDSGSTESGGVLVGGGRRSHRRRIYRRRRRKRREAQTAHTHAHITLPHPRPRSSLLSILLCLVLFPPLSSYISSAPAPLVAGSRERGEAAPVATTHFATLSSSGPVLAVPMSSTPVTLVATLLAAVTPAATSASALASASASVPMASGLSSLVGISSTVAMATTSTTTDIAAVCPAARCARICNHIWGSCYFSLCLTVG